jgi:hypothetical protein
MSKYENKTKATEANVIQFIEAVDNEQKRKDSYRLIELMSEATGHEAKLWGPSIIGFGSYHYKYASGHEGDAPMLGFSPRKAAISLYVSMGMESEQPLIEKLGKCTMGKACIYVKKLGDINEDALKALMSNTLKFLHERYPRQ